MPFCHITLTAQKPPDPAYPKTLITFGDYIRKERLDRKLTAEQVGHLVGVDRDTIYSWEYHKCDPMPSRFSPIIKFLGYEPKVKLRQFYGQDILDYRHKKELTQHDLAEFLGIHITTLRQWERNRKRPSKKMFEKFSSFFGDLSSFHGEKDTKS